MFSNARTFIISVLPKAYLLSIYFDYLGYLISFELIPYFLHKVATLSFFYTQRRLIDVHPELN